MNKIEELIEKLCPNGVEYKMFGDIATIQRGASPRPIARFITEDENGFPWIKIGDTTPNSKYVTRTEQKITVEGASKSRVLKKGDFIMSNSMSFGRPYILNIDGAIHDGWASISNFGDKLNSNFLYHFLSSDLVQNYWVSKINSGSVSNLNSDIIKSLYVPVPPLQVQREIVRILDTFSEYTSELTKELTEELTMRKKQYEYYRDELFGKDYEEMIKRCKNNNIDIFNLSEIGEFIRGKRFVRSDIISEGVPCIHYGDLYTYLGISTKNSKNFISRELAKKMRFAQNGDVVIVQAGENDMEIGNGVAWLSNEKVAVHDACYIFKHSINAKYISHYLRTNIYHLQIKKNVSTGKICSITSKNIGKAKIPVPPLEEQQRIVDILDRFDTLCNDISKGLPAEIEARQKQYEYYRDKLLTFKNIND